ncbi:MAG: hypothetical protein KF916_04005 [Microbacteriaceae bacterium]|nr:hypothetical protein [Microbacteriaceae bacterium]
MSEEAEHDSHGNSIAAWVSVLTMAAAVVVGTVSFYLAEEWLVWASAGVLLVGLALGPILAKLGFGAKAH